MARYLVDSNALLWFQAPTSGQLAREAREAIEAGENTVFVSLAALWELAVKAAKGKLPDFKDALRRDADAIVADLALSGLTILPIELRHALGAATLPPYHGDPFDRMMIAQARLEGLTVITRDRMFARYGVPVLPA